MTCARYITVILPLPVAGTFTYRVPPEDAGRVTVGSRVIVPFGKRKFYTGIVTSFDENPPQTYTIKDIISVPDSEPVLRHPQLRLWEWISEYYLCSVGEVYKSAVPPGLKIESETKFELNPDFDASGLDSLPAKEVEVMKLLDDKGALSAKDIEKETGFSSTPTMLQTMIKRGSVIVSESLVDRYRPQREHLVKLTFGRGDAEAVSRAFVKVKGAPKQEKMLLTLLHLSQMATNDGVTVASLLETSQGTSATLKALTDKGVAEKFTRDVSRFHYSGAPAAGVAALTSSQQVALSEIHSSFAEHNTTLLHGITSSGKTEVYTHLAQHVLQQGRQVLYLVPEIALTTQLTTRLQNVFGDKVIVYHSKFTDNERVDIWRRLLHSNEPYIVLGARSALFLPFAKLGLVIVDEEHDPSFKQFDPAPRYNARDTAIMLAYMHGAKTLLGSATPAIDTYYKALGGKYGLVKLTGRYGGAHVPEIEIVNMARERQRKMVKGSFAISTIDEIKSAVEQGKQAIVFHNRRGFAPMARCTQCQYIPKCTRCDVSLTYHKRANTLMCHYCGASYPMPAVCPACKEPTVEIVGYGTERVEDEVEEIFSGARSLRMDLDTTRSKNSYARIIDTFSSHKADILVGTQMVTKGLDFGDVTVVAVINADAVINYPDFRSAERAYNMLEQVSGRAGRRDNAGKVVIQTRNPEHPVIGFLRSHDYDAFYAHEIEERRAFSYPPFSRVINIVLRHRDERELDEIASTYAARLRQLFGSRVNGPTVPFVSRIRNLYIRQLMLKVELNASMSKVKEILRDVHAALHASMSSMRGLIIHYDVDP